jgi:transcriptional regulator with XRE-family HTH domain
MNDKTYLKRLGKKIKSLREAKGLTQEQLAERLDTKHTQIGRMERGEANSTINMLRKLAEELDVPISELVRID